MGSAMFVLVGLAGFALYQMDWHSPSEPSPEKAVAFLKEFNNKA